MKHIAYQGTAGSYHDYVCSLLRSDPQTPLDLPAIGYESFDDVFAQVDAGNIGVMAIENSYAGSLHTNFYRLAKGGYRIIGEYYLPIEHALLATHTDITALTSVYSHPQALMQCAQYCQQHNLTQIPYHDTAAAAQMVKQTNDPTIAAIASAHAGPLYELERIDTSIQDQDGNTTRFLIIVRDDITPPPLSDTYAASPMPKTSLVFITKHMPSVLYKSLGAFATRGINLTKIESLPAQNDPFSYMFWLDYQTDQPRNVRDAALDELGYFTSMIRVLGEY